MTGLHLIFFCFCKWAITRAQKSGRPTLRILSWRTPGQPSDTKKQRAILGGSHLITSYRLSCPRHPTRRSRLAWNKPLFGELTVGIWVRQGCRRQLQRHGGIFQKSDVSSSWRQVIIMNGYIYICVYIYTHAYILRYTCITHFTLHTIHCMYHPKTDVMLLQTISGTTPSFGRQHKFKDRI